MKLNSISGITYGVKDLQASLAFYEKLGFRPGNQDATHALCYVNWFWVDLVVSGHTAQDESTSLAIKVDSIDECYQEVIANGMKPHAEPAQGVSGNREFTLSDPDGHHLVFFEKK